MVRLLSQRQPAVVRRDRPGEVVDVEVHAVARLEAENLEIDIDRLHPRQVRPVTLGKVQVVAPGGAVSTSTEEKVGVLFQRIQ